MCFGFILRSYGTKLIELNLDPKNCFRGLLMAAKAIGIAMNGFSAKIALQNFWIVVLWLGVSTVLNAQNDAVMKVESFQSVRSANDAVLLPQVKPVIPKTSLSYHPKPLVADTAGSTKIELLQAIELKGRKLSNGREMRTVLGNSSKRVIFLHNGALITCDSALHFPDSNFVAAYGNIEVQQGDTLTLKGDTAYYFGNSKLAQVRGNIELKDRSRTLITKALDYDMHSGIAGYYNYGRVLDDTSVLDSKIGYYDTRNKKITFIQKVSIYNIKTSETLKSDTLVYDLLTKDSKFNSKTFINTKDGTIETDGGSYDPKTSDAEFTKRTCIENDDYRICADYIKNTKSLQQSIAKGNVSLHQKKDTLFLYGQAIVRQGDTSRVYGEPVLIKPFGQDSLFVTADTLMATQDSTQSRSIFAYHKVKIFSNEIQGVADSLVYSPSDSVFRFYQNPALWSSDNQLTGDSISINLKNNEIDELNLKKNSFIVSKNPLGQFDQVSGKNMVAQFSKNALKKVKVDGNGQLLYHLLDKGSLQAVNRMDCSDMLIAFADSNKLASLTALVKPEAKLVPPHEVGENEIRLPKFVWRSSERPNKFIFDVLLKRATQNQDPRFKVAGGLLVCEKPFVIWFSKDSLLTFLKDQASSEDIKASFFVEIRPDSSKIQNWDSLRTTNFRTEFSIPASALDGEFLRYTHTLDSIHFLSLRVGQFKKQTRTDIRTNLEIVEKPELWFCEWTYRAWSPQTDLKPMEQGSIMLGK
jgi:lipopolysaccharide export system protein LptA